MKVEGAGFYVAYSQGEMSMCMASLMRGLHESTSKFSKSSPKKDHPRRSGLMI